MRWGSARILSRLLRCSRDSWDSNSNRVIQTFGVKLEWISSSLNQKKPGVSFVSGIIIRKGCLSHHRPANGSNFKATDEDVGGSPVHSETKPTLEFVEEASPVA